MFICRDVTGKNLLSVYWEEDLLFVVVKQDEADGTLYERAAVSYSSATARELMLSLSSGCLELHSVRLDSLTAVAIAGRIAEGLRRSGPPRAVPRIRREHWN